MKIRTAGTKMTFYDDDGNVIGHDPPLPPEDPDEEVMELDIVEYEDRLMGIDPNAVPDFFVDIDELTEFIDRIDADKSRYFCDRPEVVLAVLAGLSLALGTGAAILARMFIDTFPDLLSRIM